MDILKSNSTIIMEKKMSYEPKQDFPLENKLSDIMNPLKRRTESSMNEAKPTPDRGKSLEELAKEFDAKLYRDESASDYLQKAFVNFYEFVQSQSSPVEERGWVRVEDELPEIGKYVEVITGYYCKGKPASQRFIGYINEEGDLASLPEDDNYGLLFSECVTYWRYLSKPPKQTNN